MGPIVGAAKLLSRSPNVGMSLLSHGYPDGHSATWGSRGLVYDGRAVSTWFVMKSEALPWVTQKSRVRSTMRGSIDCGLCWSTKNSNDNAASELHGTTWGADIYGRLDDCGTSKIGTARLPRDNSLRYCESQDAAV